MSKNLKDMSSPSSLPIEAKDFTACPPTRSSTGFSTGPSLASNAYVKSGESSLSTGSFEIKTESPSEDKETTVVLRHMYIYHYTFLYSSFLLEPLAWYWILM